jgi:hypothetical protein
MTILVQRKFCIYSTFLDTTLQAEDERLNGESIEDGIMRVIGQLEQTADRLRKAANPHLYQDHPFKDLDLGWGPGIRPPVNPIPIPIITKDKDKLEIDIDNATSVDNLRILKDSAEKYGLITHYVSKFNELNNDRPANFTEGLE